MSDAVDANLLVLAHAAVTPDGELPMDRIAAQLTDLGYEYEDGQPISRHDLYRFENNVNRLLVNIAEPPAEGRRPRSHVSAVASALARALQH